MSRTGSFSLDSGYLVVVVAAMAAIGAILAPGEATGLLWWDPVLRATFAFLVVIAAARGPRWVPIVLASAGAGAVGLTSWVVPAWLALLVAVATIVMTRRSRWMAALSAAITIQVLLRLPAIGFFGLPSLIAGVASAIVLVFGYRYSTSTNRKRMRFAVLVAICLALIFGVVGSMLLVSTRSDIARGIASAERGLDAARRGELAIVSAELGAAESALSAAADRASSPLLWPTRLVPVAAQHRHALVVATEQGALVAREAARAAEEADLSSVSLDRGEVDLAALQRMAPKLTGTAAALAAVPDALTEADSRWLLPAVRDRLAQLRTEVEQVLPESELAAQAAQVVPELLGALRPTTYLVLFGTPAESREFGGFVGSYAVMRFVDGRIEIVEAERINELYELARSNKLSVDDFPVWFADMGNPTQYPQNLTSSPDFGVVAMAATQVLAGLAEQPLDGVVYMDTLAVATLLELTGPVPTTIRDEPLSASDAAQLLLFDQYRLETTGRTDIFDELARVAVSVASQLTEVALPAPRTLGEILGPPVRAGRLQMITFDERHNSFLRSVKLLRDFEVGAAQDFVGLVQTNSVESKLDLYLTRQLNYGVTIAPDGSLVGKASVELRSLIPDDAPPLTLGRGDGTARPLLSLYTPHGVGEVRVNGSAVPFGTSVEFGFQRALVEVPVPPTGEPVTVEYDVFGLVDPTIPYDVKVWHQPLVNTDQMSVSYTGPDGSFDHSVELVENMIFSSDGAVQE